MPSKNLKYLRYRLALVYAAMVEHRLRIPQILVPVLFLSGCGDYTATHVVTNGIAQGDVFSIVTAPITLPFAVTVDTLFGGLAEAKVQDEHNQEAEANAIGQAMANAAQNPPGGSTQTQSVYVCVAGDQTVTYITPPFWGYINTSMAPFYASKFMSYVQGQGVTFSNPIDGCVGMGGAVAARNFAQAYIMSSNIQNVQWKP